MQTPVALQLRQALALFCVPEDDPSVIAAACENLMLAVERPGDCPDPIAAIFKHVSIYMSVTGLRLLR